MKNSYHLKRIRKSTRKIVEKTQKPISRTYQVLKKTLSFLNKAITLGANIFDYVVKVSKVVALVAGAWATSYFVSEIPNREEGEPLRDVAKRSFDNMGKDITNGMDYIMPPKKKGHKPPSKSEENTQNKGETRPKPEKITTQVVDLLSQNISNQQQNQRS